MLHLAPGKQFFAVCGELMKIEPWLMEGEKGKPATSGFAGSIRIWGATVKFGCDEMCYVALKQHVGRVIQIEGEAVADQKTHAVKCSRVSRVSIDGQQVFGQAESGPAGAADPGAVSQQRAGVFGSRKAAA